MKDKEIIKRIEQAPKEMQTMVAKAFLRDDIPNENVQYLFNTQNFEDYNEPSVEIINENAEQPVGIGSGEFTMRTSIPYDNPFYITQGWGGYSTCIKGNPMNDHANVLANCVGYASGRFNELMGMARDIQGLAVDNLCCNACDFYDVAIQDGFAVGQEPRVGAIMCWSGGYGGCGHVAVVERVDSPNQIMTSESDWGGSQFFNAIRKNDNGRWGLASNFYFKGFIYQHPDVQYWINGITPNVPRDTSKNQIEVLIDDLSVMYGASVNDGAIGLATKGFYNYYETRVNDGYTWYRIDKDRGQWIASKEGWTNVYPAEQPTTPPTQPPEEYIKLKVLDRKDGNVLVDLPIWIKE